RRLRPRHPPLPGLPPGPHGAAGRPGSVAGTRPLLHPGGPGRRDVVLRPGPRPPHAAHQDRLTDGLPAGQGEQRQLGPVGEPVPVTVRGDGERPEHHTPPQPFGYRQPVEQPRQIPGHESVTGPDRVDHLHRHSGPAHRPTPRPDPPAVQTSAPSPPSFTTTSPGPAASAASGLSATSGSSSSDATSTFTYGSNGRSPAAASSRFHSLAR